MVVKKCKLIDLNNLMIIFMEFILKLFKLEQNKYAYSFVYITTFKRIINLLKYLLLFLLVV